LFLSVLERVRQQYGFAIIGCVVMPEHVHLLLSKPERANLSIVVQVLKQIVSRKVSASEQHAPVGSAGSMTSTCGPNLSGSKNFDTSTKTPSPEAW
jgi:REP element-mobilizing transposase RayT